MSRDHVRDPLFPVSEYAGGRVGIGGNLVMWPERLLGGWGGDRLLKKGLGIEFLGGTSGGV
jgi:hypothetical protein